MNQKYERRIYANALRIVIEKIKKSIFVVIGRKTRVSVSSGLQV